MRLRVGIAHAAVVIIGLLIVAYPLTIGAATEVTCRGAVMGPGDSCAKSGGSGVQTYEQRATDRRNAAPVIVGVGLLVTAFGTALLVSEVRRPRPEPNPV